MTHFIPYGRQIIDDDDVAAVTDVLRGDWLTTGPTVVEFEKSFAEYVGSDYAVAVSNGTAALHLAMLAGGVGPGDEVIVPSLTFAASANCARYVGADVVFADVRDDLLTVDVASVASQVNRRTRAIVAVDYAGIPCDMAELRSLAEEHDLLLVSDASHALGATYRGQRVGGIADMSTFSFHPVKHMTTGEGGMVTTDSADLAARLRKLRNHGIDTDFRQREGQVTWEYDVDELGFNYRLSDINCALGLSQLRQLEGWVEERRRLAARYHELLGDVDHVRTMRVPNDRESSWHLFPIVFTGEDREGRRHRAFIEMRAAGIGVNVHYRPVHLHTVYRDLGCQPGQCPAAERAYGGLLSLPMWAGLTNADQDRVVDELAGALR